MDKKEFIETFAKKEGVDSHVWVKKILLNFWDALDSHTQQNRAQRPSKQPSQDQ